MKTSICLMLLFIGSLAFGENLLLEDGKLLKNVTIVSADPVRMLVVHDGGGLQLNYSDIAEGSLSAAQKTEIEEGLKEYSIRQTRLEETRVAAEIARVEKEAFEQSQIEKGLVKFEDAWMTPQDRQDILAGRELDRLKQERLTLELEHEKEKLRQSQLIAEQERARLISYERPRTVVYSSSCYPARKIDYACEPYSRSYKKRSHFRSSGLHVSISSPGNFITYRSASPSIGRVSVPVIGCSIR